MILDTAKPLVAAILLGYQPIVALAQVTPPGAGTILQQVQPVKPTVPSSVGTGLTIERAGGVQSPPSAPFHVTRIEITGNTSFDTATLHALVADVEGKDIGLAQLGEAVDRISDYYHNHGFPLARAVIPAQSIRDGVVRVMVVEAHYGKIEVENHSRASDALLQQTLASLQAGQSVSQAQLDHALLLVSDIPGVVATSVLKPGDTTGTSDLLVQANATAPFAAGVTVDNSGNRFTGRTRLGANLSVIDPLQHGDVLTVSALTSGSDMNYGSLSYETLLNGLGTRIGGAYSALHYTLGDTLTALDGHGTAQVASIWIKHPFVRTRETNLYAQLQFDNKRLDDQIGASNIDTKRHLDNWTLSVNGDWRTAALGGGVGTWGISILEGKVDFGNVSAQVSDAATAKTQGNFSKWNANIAYLQNLSQSNALFVSLSGQSSNGNLDASEKMTAGGPNSVRAYDVGVLSGDTGVFGSAELRHDFGQLWAGDWQVLGFIDSEHITVNKSPWLAGNNNASLSGAGVGLNWFGTDQWHAKLFVATPIGATPELAGKEKSTRAWAEIGKNF
ncbi:MAG TPA: ShlB/FhaC/HecB family hemolysin secretion/activation protein [Burkholderiaceae bacterium]